MNQKPTSKLFVNSSIQISRRSIEQPLLTVDVIIELHRFSTSTLSVFEIRTHTRTSNQQRRLVFLDQTHEWGPNHCLTKTFRNLLTPEWAPTRASTDSQTDQRKSKQLINGGWKARDKDGTQPRRLTEWDECKLEPARLSEPSLYLYSWITRK